MIPVRLIGPKVLIALEPKGTEVEDSTGMHYHDKGRTESGLILAQPTDLYDADEHSRGIVMALGTRTGTVEIEVVKRCVREALDFDGLLKQLDRLTPAPFEVEVGDAVLFSPSVGVSLGEQDDGITYIVVHVKDIMAVIAPKVEAA